MLTRNEAYLRARVASEQILADTLQAADQLSADAKTDADAKLRQARFSAEARADRDAAYSAAADARAAAMPKPSNGTTTAWRRYSAISDNRWRAAAIPTPTTLLPS